MHQLGSKLFYLGLLLLGLSVMPQALQAETERLSTFTAHVGPLRLTGIQDQFDLYLPLASTVAMESAELDLKFSRSLSMLARRSTLSVRLNETTLAQIPYTPDQSVTRAKVRIPAELWRPGFNKLTLAVVQHYAAQCEDRSAPELWTELDLHSSTLAYRFKETSQPLTLQDLSGLFSPGIGGQEEVLLLSAPKGEQGTLSPAELEALPTVAQALALRRDFAPLDIKYSRWRTDRSLPDRLSDTQWRRAAAYLPGERSRTHVLVGTREELKAILPAAVVAGIKGPHLQIERAVPLLDRSGKKVVAPGGIRLIVSGTTEEELLLAARTLAEMDDRLNPVSQTTILDRRLETTLPLAGSRFLQPENSYSFEALGNPTTTMGGAGARKVRVNIPMGADFYSRESAQAELLLDFGYGAGLGEGSIMNVYLNGEYIHGLSLNQTGGAAFRGYRITLPSRKLVPGMNTLEFDFTLRSPTLSGECRAVPGNHLIVQMLGSSSLTLPKAQAVAEQPNLAIFSGTGYPNVSATEVRPTRIYVADETMIGTALTLAGKLAQVVKTPADSIHIGIGIPETIEGHALVLATPSLLPEVMFKDWKIALGRSLQWPYRLLNDLRDSYQNGSLALELTRSGERLSGSITQEQGLGDLGVVLAVKNPYDSTPSTVTILLADSAEMLDRRVRDLCDPALWGQMRGDLGVWQDVKKPMVTMQVADNYEVGASGRMERMLLTLSNNPWYVAALLLVVIAVLSLLAHRFLKGRKAQKMDE